jgi:hypothetical protein
MRRPFPRRLFPQAVLYVIFVEDLHLVRWGTESVAEHGQ